MAELKSSTDCDNVRLAGLRLLLIDDDAARIIEYLETGRVDLAKVFALAITKKIKQVHEDLRRAGA